MRRLPRSDAPAAAVSRPRVRRGRLPGDGIWPWLFIAPLMIGIGVFYFWPIVQTGWLSLTDTGPFGGSTFTGFDNYQQLVTDPDFYRSLGNTLLYTAIVLLGVPLAVILASLLNTKGLRFAAVYRVLFFLPYVAMPAAVGIVWRLMYNGDFGVVNRVLAVVGIEGPYWISTPGAAVVAVSVVGLWSSVGFSMIILAAGLGSIPTELYEASALDGATSLRQFTAITVPLLRPSIFFVTTVTVIACFQVFDLLYVVLGNANPVLDQSTTLVYYFYREGFITHDQGLAAAIALAVLLIIGVVTFAQFRIQRRWAL